MTTTKDNAELVVNAALRAVFAERRPDLIDHFFSPDFVQHSPYAPPGGRDELRQWWASIIEAIPDVTTVIDDIVAEDTRVAVFRVVRGTIRGDMPAFGITGDGQPLSLRIAEIFEVEGGQITALWEVADTGPLAEIATAQPRHQEGSEHAR